MKILSLHIEGFGKFHDLDISFKDGLNVVYGKNEAGKSTLHTFIRGMLFGIEKQRGRAARNDVYSKYEPWKGSGTYEGWMRLESEGQIYRFQRRFQKQNKELTIVNETQGREMEPTKALLDQLRCGLSETAYDNTISIGQLKCATDGGMVAELRNYIASKTDAASAKEYQQNVEQIRDAEAAKNSSDKGMVMKKETLNEETQKTTTVVSGIVVGVIVIVAFVMLAILIRRRRKNMVE